MIVKIDGSFAALLPGDGGGEADGAAGTCGHRAAPQAVPQGGDQHWPRLGHPQAGGRLLPHQK